ncbi:MAG: hypothetical protein H6581_13665 [Bacteroidia bacterium]|nr:hypothetical protein [Bacteroidia bacterium]
MAFSPRKLLLLCLLFLLSQAGMGQGFAPGGGLTFGTESNTMGFNARAYFFVNEKLCFGPELNWYLPHVNKTTAGTEYDGVWEINLNGHYLFRLGASDFYLYPLGGINYTSVWSRDKNKSLTNEPYFGLNAGGGLNYCWNNLIPYLEYDFLWGKRGNHTFVLGTFWMFGK